MERLTARDGDVVYYREGECILAPVNMSGFDVRKVLERLAELEDKEEPAELLDTMLQGQTFYHCSKCRSIVFKAKYCGNCGQAVKHNGKK